MLPCMLSRSTLGMSVAVRYPDYLGVSLAPCNARTATGHSAGHTLTPWPETRRGRGPAGVSRPSARSFTTTGACAWRYLRCSGEVIDFDAYVWLLTDPVTAVGVAPLADVPCLPELPALIRAKYATPVNRWTVLRLQSSPSAP